MMADFKKFLSRGNVVDLAVAVVIGAAFGKIVTSFVADILMPPIGMLLGKMDFSNFYISLTGQTFASLADAKKAGAPTLNYGVFLNNVLDFVIVAFAVFLMVKLAERFKKKEAAAAPATQACPQCLSQIPIGAKRCACCTSALA